MHDNHAKRPDEYGCGHAEGDPNQWFPLIVKLNREKYSISLAWLAGSERMRENARREGVFK